MSQHKFWTTVSRETIERLEIYERLLRKWQTSLNLVSKTTLSAIWDRHFLDSAQLYQYVYSYQNIACLGSGGGFPGIVLAILGCSNVTLIERDLKKAIFLRTVLREVGLQATIINDDIVNCDETFDCIVSRALATVHDLFLLSAPVRHEKTVCFFLKGAQIDEEIRQASQIWDMTYNKIHSITNKDGVIFHVSQVDYKR